MVTGDFVRAAPDGRAPVPRPLPLRSTYNGPHVTRVMRRSATVLAVVWLVAAVVVLAPVSTQLQVVAAGVLVPGGSWLLLGHPVWFVVAAVLTGLSFVAWWGVGFILAVPLATSLSVLLAMLLGGDDVWEPVAWILVLIAAGAWLGVAVARQVGVRRGQDFVREANAWLDVQPRREIVPTEANRELDDYELGRSRHLVDLSLQPLDAWDGFDVIDQFREAAVRYQLSSQTWGLAFLRHNRLPAFAGYVQDAQRRSIEKMLVRGVWSYWFWENLWGNFRWNPEPILHNNIMYSGYLLFNAALYQQTTGDDRYLSDGSMQLRWNADTLYEHSQHTVARAVRDNFVRSSTCFYACEPHWIFAACNQIGWAGVLGHDAANGTSLSAGLEDPVYEAMLLDYADHRGRASTVRSQRFGFAVPALKTALGGDLMGVWYMNAMLPDVAERTWLLAKRDNMHITDDGLIDIRRGLVDRVDPANYTRSEAMADIVVHQVGAELGDAEYAEAARRTFVHKYPTRWDRGRARHEVSTGLNNFSALGTFGGHGTLRTLLTTKVEHAGPRLWSAPYPEVVVRSALGDGEQARLVLDTGTAHGTTHGGPSTLVVDRLRPGARYRVTGSHEVDLVADRAGAATFDVEVRGRTVLTIAPEV